jgi:hypothetical protein
MAAMRRSAVATVETTEGRAPPRPSWPEGEAAPLLRFRFDAESEDESSLAGRPGRGEPRSIKDALVRWLDEQL